MIDKKSFGITVMNLGFGDELVVYMHVQAFGKIS